MGIIDNKNNFIDGYDFGRPPESHLARFGRFIWEMFRVVVISLIIIVPVRYFLIQPFYVKGASMEPNFEDHDYLIIDEITYRFAEPKRGDIVVFRYPDNPKSFFIKRVVGLPGERVQIENSLVFIGRVGESLQLLPESYLPQDIKTNLPVRGYSDVTLKDNEYFVLGDNRDKSYDSRVFGPVPRDFIVGRTWLRGWPFNRLTIFSTPQYNNFNN